MAKPISEAFIGNIREEIILEYKKDLVLYLAEDSLR
jgi:hypothetical protein